MRRLAQWFHSRTGIYDVIQHVNQFVPGSDGNMSFHFLFQNLIVCQLFSHIGKK